MVASSALLMSLTGAAGKTFRSWRDGFRTSWTREAMGALIEYCTTASMGDDIRKEATALKMNGVATIAGSCVNFVQKALPDVWNRAEAGQDSAWFCSSGKLMLLLTTNVT